MRFSSSDISTICNDIYILLGKVIGKYQITDCGIGLEAISRLILDWRGVGGVYIFVNLRTGRIYVGSSSDISKRMGYYKGEGKKNLNLSKAIKKYGWSAFRTIVISIPGGRETRLRWEYKIMNLLKKSGIRLYNRFMAEKDRLRYHDLKGRGVGGVDRLMKRYILVREKLRKIAIERRYGEKIKEYRYKKGEEHKGAKRIRVIDVIKGIMMEGIKKEVVKRMGGSRSGLRESMGKGTIYKGRYIIKENKMGNKEVILEDKLTGKVSVVEQKKVPY